MLFKNTILASVIMIVTSLSLAPLSRVEDMSVQKPLSEFPLRVGDWAGTKGQFDPKVYDILGVDDSILADYKNQHGDLINLYAGFYQSQRKGDIIHSPKNCMPGAGWKITRTERVDVDIPGNSPGRIEAIKLRLEKDGMVNIVLYWFQSRGRFIASEYSQKIYLVLDSMFKHRTDGSFVRLIAPAPDGDEQAALNKLKTFAAQVIPILQKHLPS